MVLVLSLTVSGVWGMNTLHSDTNLGTVPWNHGISGRIKISLCELPW